MVRPPRQGHSDKRLRDAKGRLQKDRWKPKLKSVGNQEIPDAGEKMDDGSTFPGLSSSKFQDSFLQGRMFPEDPKDKKKKLPPDVMVDDGNLQTINGSKIESLSLDEDKINGDGTDKKISWGKIDHPALAANDHGHGDTYLKKSDLDNYATKTWVKQNTAGPSNNKNSNHGHTAN